jgi:hypothetical protein
MRRHWDVTSINDDADGRRLYTIREYRDGIPVIGFGEDVSFRNPSQAGQVARMLNDAYRGGRSDQQEYAEQEDVPPDLERGP